MAEIFIVKLTSCISTEFFVTQHRNEIKTLLDVKKCRFDFCAKIFWNVSAHIHTHIIRKSQKLCTGHFLECYWCERLKIWCLTRKLLTKPLISHVICWSVVALKWVLIARPALKGNHKKIKRLKNPSMANGWFASLITHSKLKGRKGRSSLDWQDTSFLYFQSRGNLLAENHSQISSPAANHLHPDVFQKAIGFFWFMYWR